SANGRPVPMVVGLLRQLDDDPGAVDAMLGGWLGTEPIAAQIQPAELAGESFQGQARIDERSEGHITAGTGKGVEVGDFHCTLLGCCTMPSIAHAESSLGAYQ